LRQRTGFKPDALEPPGRILEHLHKVLGWLGTFTSRQIVPISSTIQTEVSLTETSRPA